MWIELLKKKIAIIYDISVHKNEDFLVLLKEFIPEAFDYKSEWIDSYIFNKSNNFNHTDSNDHSDALNIPDNKLYMKDKIKKPVIKKLAIKKLAKKQKSTKKINFKSRKQKL